MSNQVIILIGPLGSGKDTQAIRLAEDYGLVQVPSSKIIGNKFTEHPDDPIIKREIEINKSGELNTPEVVAEWIMEFVRPLAAKGQGLVFSGSPRTYYEAEVEFPELLQLYGERNIRVIHMEISDERARARIARRLFCKANKHPYSIDDGFTVCPKDGSPLERRALDEESLQDVRFKEYHERTEPCLEIAKKFGVAVFDIDADRSPDAVHHDIVEIVERHRTPVSPA